MLRIVLTVATMLIAVPVLAQHAPGQTNAGNERAQAHYVTGWQQMHAEHYEAAVDEFHSATELNPKFQLAFYGLGRAYQNLHRYREAIEALTTCRQLYNAQASQKFNSQMEADRYRSDRLLELEDMKTQISKGAQSNRTQEMTRQVNDAIRRTTDEKDRGLNIGFDDPVPSFVSLSLGSAYFRSSRFDEAEQAYRAAVKTDDKAGEAHNNLAVIYLMKAQYPQALAEVRAAEKAGVKVSQDLKDEIRGRMGQ